MRTLEHHDINRVLKRCLSDETVPMGWKGTVLDLLIYKELPPDSRLCAALRLLKNKPQVLEQFCGLALGLVVDFDNSIYAAKAAEYALYPLNADNAVHVATNVMRAYFERNLQLTKSADLAIKAMIGATEVELSYLWVLIKVYIKESN